MPSSSIASMTPTQRRMTLCGLYLALFMITFLNAMGNIVGALIAGDLQNMDMYALMYSIFYLCSASVMPFTSKLGERFGRKKIILFGVAIYAIGTMLAGFAPNMTFHVLMRGLQGMGQGFLLVNTLAFFGEFCDATGRAKAMGWYNTITGITWVIAPMIGGIVGDALGWRPVFYAVIPFAIVILVLLIAFMPNGRLNKDETKIDFLGAISLIIAVCCIVLTFTWGGSRYPWGSPVIIGLIIGFVVFLIIFLVAIRKSPNPVISPKLFKNREFVLIVLCVMLVGPSMFVVGSYLSAYCIAICGTTATVAGTVAAVKSAVQLVLGYALGVLIAKSHKRLKVLLISLPIFYIISNLMFGFSPTFAPLWFVYLAAILSGYCTTVFMMSFTLDAQNSVDENKVGEATSTVQFIQSLSGTIGLSIMGMVLNNALTKRLADVVPDGLTDYASAEQIGELANANILTNPSLGDELLSTMPAEGQALFGQMVENIRGAYADSLGVVFVVLCIMLAVALVLILFLKTPKREGSAMADAEEGKIVEDVADAQEVAQEAASAAEDAVAAVGDVTAEVKSD